MRILFVQKMAGISGSENYLMQFLPELKRRGYHVEMMVIYHHSTERNKPLIDRLARSGIHTYQLYKYNELSPLLLRAIAKIVKEGKFDIVQTNLHHADLWLSMVKILFLPRLKIVSVKHGFIDMKINFDQTKLNGYTATWVQRLVDRFINKHVTISYGLEKLYTEGEMLSANKTQTIHYGIDPSAFGAMVEERVYDGSFAVILGRVIEFKGHKYLLQAWKKVKERFPDRKLKIIGDGDYLPVLKKLVKEYQLEDVVEFCGFQPNPHQYLHDCEFSVVPSVFEGFGMIILESWYHKRPMIVFDVPACNELIKDKEDGFIVKLFDTEALTEKIIYMFEHPEKTREMGERGNEKLYRDFTLGLMADKMEEVYKSLVPSNVVHNDMYKSASEE